MDYLRNAAARSRSNPPQKRRAPSQQHEPSPPPAARSNDDLPASDPRQQRLAALERLSQQLSKLKQDFRPPTGLTFQRTATAANPKLDFEPLNAPVLGYDEALLKLMIALDGVESEGDVVVREARKKIVREVDRELARLDRLRREAFENGGRVTLQQGEQEEQGAKEKQLREQKEKVDRMLQSAGELLLRPSLGGAPQAQANLSYRCYPSTAQSSLTTNYARQARSPV